MKFIGSAIIVLSALAFFTSQNLNIWPYCLGACIVGIALVLIGKLVLKEN